MDSPSPSHPGHLLMTGAYRSGTTLLEKLLHNHPDLSVAMQPFPVLFFYAKERFLESKGLPYRYALDHLFLEDRYQPEELASFLDDLELTSEDVDGLFERLTEYGSYTPGAESVRDQVAAGSFFDVYYQWDRGVARLLGKDDVTWMGNKEIFCEELAPAFLEKGRKVVQIIRDPRDVIASLHFRKRDNQTGDPRPLLFNLRVWRKSAAFALALAGHPSYRMVRYEDLLDDTTSQLTMLTEWLGVPDYEPDAFSQGIRDHDGSPWRGNSSFGDKAGISRAASGSYKKLVPTEAVRYIETLCEPEMEALGYEFATQDRLDRIGLGGFEEPSDRVHPLFDPGYSTKDEHLDAEIARLGYLAADSDRLDEASSRTWFIHPNAYTALRGADQ